MTIKKNSVALALVCSMITSGMIVYSEPIFSTEEKNHWAAKSISDFQEKGYITGYDNGDLRLDQHITRAEFITFLNRVMNFKIEGEVVFTDVPPDKWFYREIAIAMGNGYIKGFEDHTFRPNAPITRAEAAVLIAKVKKWSAPQTSVSALKDENKIPAWAKESILALMDHGIMNGYPDNSFQPQVPLTRAEAIVSLGKFKEKEKNTVEIKPIGIPDLGKIISNSSISKESKETINEIRKEKREKDTEDYNDNLVYYENEGTLIPLEKNVEKPPAPTIPAPIIPIPPITPQPVITDPVIPDAPVSTGGAIEILPPKEEVLPPVAEPKPPVEVKPIEEPKPPIELPNPEKINIADSLRTPQNQNVVQYERDGRTRTVVWVKGVDGPRLGDQGDFARIKDGDYEYDALAYLENKGWYDVNKLEENDAVDRILCSGAVSSNMLHWWFDQNRDYINRYVQENKDNGVIQTKLGEIRDVRNYIDSFRDQQNSEIVNLFKKDFGATGRTIWSDTTIDLFINGYRPTNSDTTNIEENYVRDDRGGFFYDVFGRKLLTDRTGSKKYDTLELRLKQWLGEGRIIGITHATLTPISHIITVWGAEFNEDGHLTGIFVTDSDDRYTYPEGLKGQKIAMKRVDVRNREGYAILTTNQKNPSYGAQIGYLYSLSIGEDSWKQYFESKE